MPATDSTIEPITDSTIEPSIEPTTVSAPGPAAAPRFGHDSLQGAAPVPRFPRPGRFRLPLGLRSETGAATAEYAVATMAAVGFAGLLIVILRGDEVRGILTDLVRNALSVG
ncbi:DUF4244 domain-containing protein [Cryobacterium cheniae]|uniref:DUF4244 domain-containing protein n=1 Tax=Cryobacterium cheniae TaxID=1259262 RepID=UPI003B96E43E